MSEDKTERFSVPSAILLGCAGLLCTLFLLCAIVRRLNFDESLALHAGWLQVEGVPALPPFLMPTTLLWGAFSHWVHDPGSVFTLLRLFCSITVLATFLWALKQGQFSIQETALCLILALLQGTFIVHALEFRYDWALLVGMLLVYGFLLRADSVAAFSLGVVTAFLASHHIKGVVLAACVIVLCGWRFHKQRKLLALSVFGMLGGFALWWIPLWITHQAGNAWSTYVFFQKLSASSDKVPFWQSLGPAFVRDFSWWIFVFVLLLWNIRHHEKSEMKIADRMALVLGLATLVLVILHPHAWPYMLALPAPFLSIAAGRCIIRMLRTPENGRKLLVVVAAAVVLHFLVGKEFPGSAYWRSFHAPRSEQLQTLHQLAKIIQPQDCVFDPSGMTYDSRPCTREWYLDTLLLAPVRQGQWMTDAAGTLSTVRAIVVNSYRIGMAPMEAQKVIFRRFRLGPGGIAIPQNDPRLADPGNWEHINRHEIQSFW